MASPAGLVAFGAGHLGWMAGAVALLLLIAGATIGVVVWRRRAPA